MPASLVARRLQIGCNVQYVLAANPSRLISLAAAMDTTTQRLPNLKTDVALEKTEHLLSSGGS